MQLDSLTLMVAGCFVSALAGLILLGAWAQMRGTRALLWWAGGHFVNTVGAAAFAYGLASGDAMAATVGSGIIVVSMVLYWAGARAFFNHRPLIWAMSGALFAWLLVTALTLPAGARGSVGAFFLLTALIMCAAGGEIVVDRDEHLTTRWPLTAVLAFHAAYMLIGFVELLTGSLVVTSDTPVLSWLGLIHFERLLFMLGSTVLMITIARERVELASNTAAQVDSLTGVANRRAFFNRAERLYRRSREESSPISLIVFDLDHFKEINDTHGHLAGDLVLRSFTETAGAVLRPGDLFGRIGGEEFAAVLPGAGVEAATIVAERVRHAFEVMPKTAGGITIPATVSAGVAMAGTTAKLETVLEMADRALYRAKAFGRNRVEGAVDRKPKLATSTAARVA